MAFQFPPGPSVNQTFTPVAGVTYRWSGTAWHLIAGPGAFLTAADADTRYVNVDEAQNTTNRIINGKFAIDQRNAGNAVTANTATPNVYSLDRWSVSVVPGAGAITVQRTPDTPRAGEFMLFVNVATADATLAAGDYYQAGQAVEGFNIADLNFGTASAKPFTFAFEMYSPVGGTFAVCFRRGTDAQRAYVTTFTAVAGAVATYSVTVPGDTAAGTWNSQNGSGLNVQFTLAAGSTFFAPAANAWATGNFLSVAGCTNFMATTGLIWGIGNVRLYKGAVDFGPDRRLYAEELALCQRYYEKSYDIATVPGTIDRKGMASFLAAVTTGNTFGPDQRFRVNKRADPTMTFFNPDTANSQIANMIAGTSFSATSALAAGTTAFTAQGVPPAGTVVGQVCGYHWTASAEL